MHRPAYMQLANCSLNTQSRKMTDQYKKKENKKKKKRKQKRRTKEKGNTHPHTHTLHSFPTDFGHMFRLIFY
jgi:hypothetical protein